jgi:hypothetical protein
MKAANYAIGRSVMSVKPLFAWYDFWIGAFYDRAKRKLYIFPIPCFGIVVTFAGRAALEQSGER